jgi:hypothetical protein
MMKTVTVLSSQRNYGRRTRRAIFGIAVKTKEMRRDVRSMCTDQEGQSAGLSELRIQMDEILSNVTLLEVQF